MNEETFRHEYKYVITAQQLAVLQNRAVALLQRDAYAGADGGYNIRSVYFDDINNTCYCENEDGTDPREKYRIRIYNHSDSRISLERKSKCAGMTQKQSCLITRAQCELLLQGSSFPVETGQPPLLRRFLAERAARWLRPVVIVEYDRRPFIYPVGNVRVTFDMNIRASGECGNFLEPELHVRPILESGRHVLEMKFDGLLPDFIRTSMNIRDLQWSSFSKFYLCRYILQH